jgi:hypothetical protein
LKKRSTCQKLGGHPICQTLNPRRGMEVRCRKIILKEGCQGSCPQTDYLSKKAQAVAHVDSLLGKLFPQSSKVCQWFGQW